MKWDKGNGNGLFWFCFLFGFVLLGFFGFFLGGGLDFFFFFMNFLLLVFSPFFFFLTHFFSCPLYSFYFCDVV